MPPKPYYDITNETSLFGRKLDMPEEKVRQWALFELLSTYGININNIEIERKVKVGTRNHFADIVILREDAPYVVIECKRLENKNSEIGMQQALSYADANTMKARYAVFTNGDIWEVKKKVIEEWVNIPDLPKRIDGDYLLDLDELISSMKHISPLLYWSNQQVPQTSARSYFSCMQEIFCGFTYPLNYLDDDLCCGTDNILRVIWATGCGEHSNYIHEKVIVACKKFSKFFSKKLNDGNTEKMITNDDQVRDLVVMFIYKFENLAKDSVGEKSEDILHIRFIVSLFRYLFAQISSKGKQANFQDIPAVLTIAFQEMVGYLFEIHFRVRFPDQILEGATDLREMCHQAWIQYEIDEMGSSESFLSPLKKIFIRN